MTLNGSKYNEMEITCYSEIYIFVITSLQISSHIKV